LAKHCQEYEQKIEDAGGLDFQLLGIGGNGHIGFNEPGSLENTKTRLMMLDQSTRSAAKGDFGGELIKVPKKAITLGVSKILQAKRVVLLAWGERKAPMICNAVEGVVSAQNPSSYLQKHPNTLFIVDEAAASGLKRMKTPWLVEDVEWTNTMTKKAVTNLSLSLAKPVLKLTNEDYNDNGLSDLLALHGNAYDINIEIFNQLQHTISGWPGGKPNAEDTNRPERAQPAKKRCLILVRIQMMIHPSMGGVLSQH
ncbi:UNVERIFIED_CONTAM: hypothetical protein GTU68_065851, partial [Idotea baltica]|nr:hypothetical protein [Idotea baltica]